MMFIQIVFALACVRPAAAAFPGLLVDYSRLPGGGVTDLPYELSAMISAPREFLALQWVAIDERDRILVRIVDTKPHVRRGRNMVTRSMTLRFDTLDEYRALIGAHPTLHLNPEIFPILRERRREVGLSSQLEATDDHSALLPRILQDQAVLRQLPSGLEWFKFNMRAIEMQPEGRVRLSLSGVADGATFYQSVDFDTLDEFNRVSGENVRPEDFARQTLSFWILPERTSVAEPHRGRFVMKTRPEIAAQCADLLVHGIGVSAKPVTDL